MGVLVVWTAGRCGQLWDMCNRTRSQAVSSPLKILDGATTVQILNLRDRYTRVEDIRKMIYQCCIDAVAHVFDANKGIRGITTRLLAQSMPTHVGHFPGMVASFPFLTEGAADYEEAEKKRIGKGEPSPISPISSPAAPVGPTVPQTPEMVIPKVDAPTGTDLLPHHSSSPAQGNEQSGRKADEDVSEDEGEKSPRPITYSPNYAFMPDLIPPSPVIETRGRDRDEEKEKHRSGKYVMKRGRKPMERVVLSGKHVKIPAPVNSQRLQPS
eukprot:g53665.t1